MSHIQSRLRTALGAAGIVAALAGIAASGAPAVAGAKGSGPTFSDPTTIDNP